MKDHTKPIAYMSSKYIRIYETLCPDDPIRDDDPRRGAIVAEMRAIRHAKTEQEAVAVIEWWRAWPNPQHQTALELVHEARSLMTHAARAGNRRGLRTS